MNHLRLSLLPASCIFASLLPVRSQADQLVYAYATTVFVVGSGTTLDGFRYGGAYQNPGGPAVSYSKADGTATQNPVGDYALPATHPGFGLPNMTKLGEYVWVGVFAVQTDAGKAVIQFVPFGRVKSSASATGGAKVVTDSLSGNVSGDFSGREVLITNDSGYGHDHLHDDAATSTRVGTVVSNTVDSTNTFSIADPAGAGVIHEGDHVLVAPAAHGKYRLLGTAPMDYLPPGADRNLPAALNYNWRIFASDGLGRVSCDWGPAVPYTLAYSGRTEPGVFDMGGLISPIATSAKFGIYFTSSNANSKPLVSFLISGFNHVSSLIECLPSPSAGIETVTMAEYTFHIAKRVYYQYLNNDATLNIRWMGWTE